MKITDLKDYKVISAGAAQPTTQPSSRNTIGDIAQGVADFVGARGITQQFGADIARALAPADQKNLIEYPSMKEVVGSAIQTGANLIPGAGAGAGILARAAVGGATGYAMDVGSKLQTGDPNAGMPGIGTAVGAGLPVVGAALKPATKFVGRLLKGTASGLSGVSADTIQTIIDNPQAASRVSQEIAKNGGDKVLEENARQIINGVSTIRKQASAAFSDGLEQLQKTDIQPKTFRTAVQSVLDKYGSTVENGVRTLKNVEFNDPNNLAKAKNLIVKFNNVKLDGKSLRKLADDISNASYKVATSDERLAFNQFVNDLSSSLKSAISKSTSKLDDINAAYSKDIQLVEAVEKIFGKVKFKNLSEVLKVSQKLEGLFNQKGLAPKTVDDFLQRIGVDSSSFRTSEAVRQIGNKEMGANQVGVSLGEFAREITSAVVTPEMVKNIAIITGLAESAVKPFLEKMKPAARNAVIQALLQMNQDNSTQGQ